MISTSAKRSGRHLLLWVVLFAFVIAAVVGARLYRNHIDAEHETVLLRIAEINSTPPTITFQQAPGPDGVMRYTECGDGFCFTDTVPPNLAGRHRQGGSGGIPVVDVHAICEEGVKADRAGLTKEGQRMFDACTALITGLKKS